jgi:ATP-binding cassette subfamily G (WHITE) protein 2 (PDR)
MTIGGTGDIGDNSKIHTDYFERNGTSPSPAGANPAEWMLNAIGAAPGSLSEADRHQTWRSSPEYQTIQDELARLKALDTGRPSANETSDPVLYHEFAATLWQAIASCYTTCVPAILADAFLHLLQTQSLY